MVKHYTVEPRFNEPLYDEVLVITDNILRPSNSKMYRKEPRYITKLRYSEHTLPVP